MKKKFYKMLCVLTAAVFCMTAPAVVQAAQNEKQTEAADGRGDNPRSQRRSVKKEGIELIAQVNALPIWQNINQRSQIQILSAQ